MPQFDISTFTSQFFWLVISLGLLFAILKFFVLSDMEFKLSQRDESLMQDENYAKSLEEKTQTIVINHQKLIDQEHKNNKVLLKQALNLAKNKENQAIFAMQLKKTQQIEEFADSFEQDQKNLKHSIDQMVVDCACKVMHKMTTLKERRK